MTSVLTMFRVLLPSWKFFVKMEAVPRLQWRVMAPIEGAWKDDFFVPPRVWGNFFLNPEGNSFLAHQSLLENWARENYNSATTDFLLVREQARRRVREIEPRARKFQFRLVAPISLNELFLSAPEDI